MKKSVLFVLALIFLISCESEENKNSRLTIDRYARKLNSIVTDIVKSRKEEGSQSKLTLNRFYGRYHEKLEDFNSDLNFESITEKYTNKRECLMEIANYTNDYLNTRKKLIRNLTGTSNAFSDYNQSKEYYHDCNDKIESESSPYLRKYYRKQVLEYLDKMIQENVNFTENKYSYLDNIIVLDSICSNIDSVAISYNSSTDKVKLVEFVAIPQTLSDSINDWLVSAKVNVINLDLAGLDQ